MAANQVRIFTPKYGGKLGEGFTKAEKLDSQIHPGRRGDGSQTAAGWITDLSDNRNAILLCSFCINKFNFRRNKYRARYIPDPTGITDGYMSNGMCDACKQMTDNCGGGKLFIAEEHWERISQDPQEARIRARNAWRPVRQRSFRDFFRR